VHDGLRWSTRKSAFRTSAQKIVLLFGDAPPHLEQLPLCVELAQNFRRRQHGRISTISCRHRLPEFKLIAEAGGGEAFVLKDSPRILEELVVLIFGERHRAEVMSFFDLHPDPDAGASKEKGRIGR
jgi:hypothetical protein